MLYIFDKDWTIVMPNDGGKFVNSIEQQILMPNVKEKCEELKAEGNQLAIASNQGGVAFGYMDFKKALEIVDHAARLIGASDYDFCPHHPSGTISGFDVECRCRKPKPGLLTALMGRFRATPDDTIFVGDMESDKEAAKAAGVKFVWANDFFGRDNDSP